MGLGRDDSLPTPLALDLAAWPALARTVEENYTSMVRERTSGRMATWECEGQGRVRWFWQVFKE